MFFINKKIQKVAIIILMVAFASNSAQAQITQPKWWFGVSGGANFNFYDGTTQRLNNSLIVPSAFHDGFGVKPFGSVLMEYRSSGIWGAMLNVGYDGRGGKFDDVMAPCDCPATLQTNLSYLTVEPSLRLGLPATNFFLFAGPRIAFNLTKDFSYTQEKQPNTDSELSVVNKNIFSGQIGIGYDIAVSSPNSTTQINLSPFVSYHPYFGQEPRNIESWSITTARAGVAIKFGKGRKIPVETPVVIAPVLDVTFAAHVPKEAPVIRQISETLPLLNYVFFNEESVNIPQRYIKLTKEQAVNFKEEQLQQEQSTSMTGRSASQLNVYHNILNILGDRLRSNPNATISLNGASRNGSKEGEEFAESIKHYIVDVFGINSSRISTLGRNKPLNPSEQPGGTKELALLREEDRRVDIESTSTQLLMEVGGGLMKAVQITSSQPNALDNQVVFNVGKAEDVLKSWSLRIIDENGIVQNHGPFTKNQANVPVKDILDNRPQGNYKVTMLGESKSGLPITKETTMHLVRQDEQIENAYRYSILFNFDKTTTLASYSEFLTNVVSPLISSGSKVIINGHTDIIGDEVYNSTLSIDRAQQTQNIIEKALVNRKTANVSFETSGFGENINRSPFDNTLPEERFYNRTVIIDILPGK